MSLENTHKVMRFMEALILGVTLKLVHGFCFFKLLPIGCIELINVNLANERTRA